MQPDLFHLGPAWLGLGAARRPDVRERRWQDRVKLKPWSSALVDGESTPGRAEQVEGAESAFRSQPGEVPDAELPDARPPVAAGLAALRAVLRQV